MKHVQIIAVLALAAGCNTPEYCEGTDDTRQAGQWTATLTEVSGDCGEREAQTFEYPNNSVSWPRWQTFLSSDCGYLDSAHLEATGYRETQISAVTKASEYRISGTMTIRREGDGACESEYAVKLDKYRSCYVQTVVGWGELFGHMECSSYWDCPEHMRVGNMCNINWGENPFLPCAEECPTQPPSCADVMIDLGSGEPTAAFGCGPWPEG